MKTKFSGFLTLLLAFMVQLSFAQQKTISGTVTDNNNLPIPGVNIIIKGTSTGTQSDFDGDYSISAEEGQTLVFSYVGYKTQEVTVGAESNINIQMGEDAAVLDEVVVTALGIKKEKKALGYAVTSLNSADIENRANGDITRILKGKAAGVNIISTSGLSGAGSSINIRGLTTTGNNQPLFVVDGVRFNSSTNGTGFSGTSRSLDIDPNNIENVSVLKGLSATTLYGSEGRNGVILITTKAGAQGNFNKKNEITVNISTFFNEIASLPDFTTQRGQGYYDAYYNFFGNWGATFGRPGYGNVDPNGQIGHPYGLNSGVFQDAFPDQVDDRVDYKDYQSQENFFRTGVVRNISVNTAGGTDNVSYNATFGNLEDQGFMPGNVFRRNTLGFGGSAKLSNNFTVSSTINLTDSKFTSPFTGPIFQGLYNTPKSIDLAGWPSQHPITGEEIGFQVGDQGRNPYWVLNNTSVDEAVMRGFGQISVDYKFSDAISANYRYGTDISVEEKRFLLNAGGNVEDNSRLGQFETSTLRQVMKSHTFLINFDTRFADDDFGISANVGADISRNEFYFDQTLSTEQTIYGGAEHQFFANQQSTTFETKRNVPGLFGQFTLDYNNYLFLTASARNDWTSNFVDNSQFYPGVGLSFLPTEAIDALKGDVLNYLKLRANYGSSANFFVPSNNVNDPNGIPYPTYQTLDTNPAAFDPGSGAISTATISNSLANAAIGPSLIEEYEFGIESRLFSSRLTLDASIYKRVTSDLIFTRFTDPATGYTTTPRNVNEFELDGIEIAMNLTVLKSDDFSFDIGGNFTKTDSEVTELEGDQFAVTQFATPAGAIGNYLVEGQPVNILLGPTIQTNEDGEYLIDDTGDYIINTEESGILGDPNPDFNASFFTAIAYKNLELTANLQYIKGGTFYSSSARSLLGRGLTSDTDGLQNQGIVLPGVLESTGEPNDIVISSGDSYFNNYNNGPSEFGIFDGTSIRLQEIALTYRFSPKNLEKSPFGSLSISFVGENLYFNAVNVPDGLNIDTNAIGTGVNSNGAGIEGGISPTSKRYGFNIKATF